MRIKIPVIGTVKEYKPNERPELTEIYGEESDPIRIDINLGNVSWKLIDLDIEKGLAEIEVTPAEEVSEDTGQVGVEGKPIFVARPTTGIERQALLDNVKAIVDRLDKTNKLIRKDNAISL